MYVQFVFPFGSLKTEIIQFLRKKQDNAKIIKNFAKNQSSLNRIFKNTFCGALVCTPEYVCD